MAKDEAIQNQKVFVRLDAVLHLQRSFNREQQRKSEARTNQAAHDALVDARLEVYNLVINLLELPIK